MPQACSDRVEDGIANRRTDNRRRWFTEANGRLRALHKTDVEFRRIAQAQRCVGVEISISDLAAFELRAFVKRQRQAPQRGAFHLCERPVRIDHGACIGHQGQFLSDNIAGVRIDADPRRTGDPGRHVALLTK